MHTQEGSQRLMMTIKACNKIIRTLILLAIVSAGIWGTPPAGAVPASPEGREIVQPDGTKFVLHVRGDEFFSWKETSEGYAVERDDADGFWKYARPIAGKVGFRTIRGARVGSSDPIRVGLRRRALPDTKALREHVRQRREKVRGPATGRPPIPRQPTAAESDVTSRTSVGGADAPQPPEEPPGKDDPPSRVPVPDVVSIKNVVILACFSNHWDDVSGTVSNIYGRVNTSEYSNLFNEVGYSTDGAVGSVRDYYKEVSYGKLTMDSIITAWVELPREESYYHGNQGTLAADAVDAAEAAGFDFSQADTDGDGWVDCLDIIHSGYGEEATGDPNHVWSVKGSMPSVKTYDGVSMSFYHTEPAFRGSSGTGITRIGVICHETGHFFGLPDLYDYSSQTRGLGNWCIMAGGSWNGVSGTSPAHFSAWCKVFLGFAEAVPVHSEAGFSLPRAEDNAVVGMMRDGTAGGEYFLIENRAKTGFDNTSQIYPGLVVYHIDSNSKNNDMGTWPHPLVKIEEADGDDSLGSYTAASEASDLWTSTTGLAGGFRDQTGNTNTSAMLYQTGAPYSRTNNASSYSYNRLANFSAAGSTMTFDASTLKAMVPAQYALATTNFTVSWAPCSEATKYEIQEGTNATLTSFSDGAEDEEAMHENWHVGGGLRRAETNASYAGSYCYAMLQTWGSVHHLKTREPFKVTTSTVISFYLMSHIASGNGYLKCEISNDSGDTWQTLSSDDGYIDPWASRSFNYTAINAAGIDDGDTCLLRFIADIEYASGWSSFPPWGFAVDSISITGTEIDGYSGWTTLDNNVTSNSYDVGTKAAGTYAYRVQTYANSAWQGYGPVGETTVGGNHAPTFTSDPISGADGEVGAAYSGNLSTLVNEPDVNDELTFTKLTGPAWLTVASDGTLSGTPLPDDVGTNAFTMRVTDAASAFDEAQVDIFVRPPSSALSADLVAYLPFDADYLDYSGQDNDPALSNSNSRAAGYLGANAYVLSSAGYLSFGMDPDFRFADDATGNATSYSISFWAKSPSGSYTDEPAYSSNKDWSLDGNTGWALAAGPGTASDGYFGMSFKERNANEREYDSTDAGLQTGWHHYLVVFKRDATRTCYTYIDGVEADSRTMFASGVDIDDAALPVNIGQDGTGASTRGSWSAGGTAGLDDFAFWRRALSATDAASIYAAGTNGLAMAYAQATPVITNLTDDLTLPYGDETNLAVGVISAATPSYQWRTNGTAVAGATSSSLTITNQGSAGTVNYDVVVTNTYGARTSSVIVVTLEQKTLLTLPDLTASDKVYDGNATATISSYGDLNGVAGGDDVTLDSSSAVATFTDAGVGTGKTVTVTGLSLTGADAGDYAILDQTTTADITAKELTVTGAVADDKVYDDTTDATISGSSLVGVVGGDDVSLDAEVGIFAQAGIGTDIAVTAALTISGTDAGNYALTQPAGMTADITALGLTIGGSFTAQDKVYDGTSSATINDNSLTLVTPVGGDDVSLSAVAVFGDKTVGADKAVSLTGSTLAGTDAGNYTLSLAGAPTTTADITAKGLTVAGGAVANDKVYDGTTDATILGSSLVGVVGGDDVSLDAEVGTFAQAGIGTDIAVTAALTISGTDAGNYTLTQPAGMTADITAKGLTVTGAVADDKVYDGTTDATISGSSLVGVVGGDDVSLDAEVGTFAQASVGADIAVTASLTITGADASNYTLTQPAGLSADITPAAPTLSAPVATAATNLQTTSFFANWNTVGSATGYELDVWKVDEDFSDGNHSANLVWSGDTASFDVLTDGALPDGSASTDGSFLASKGTVDDSLLITPSTEVSEWRFSLGTPDINPSDENYFGVVLMSSAAISGDIVTNNFQGYYLRIGNNTTPDQIRLYRSSGSGKVHEGTFSSPAFTTGGLKDGINVRVTRDGGGVWKLWTSTGFEYGTDATNYCGSITQSSYDTSSYFGVYAHIGGADPDRRVYIDNIELGARNYVTGFEDKGTTALTEQVTGLGALADYAYMVRATNATETSTNSNIISVQTLTATVTATAATNVQSTSFFANWNDVSGDLGYLLDVFQANEDFDDDEFASSPAWSGDSVSFEILTDNTLPNGNASTDGHYLGTKSGEEYVSLSVASTETNEWRFSVGSPDFDPSDGSYISVVLIASAQPTTGIAGSTFAGYYLKFGDNGSADQIELWRKTGAGEEIEGTFATSPNIDPGALRDGLNLRVTRDANGVFDLWYETGFTYTNDPANYAGAVTNTLYTGASAYFGVCADIGSPSTDRRIYIDNIMFGSGLNYATGYEDGAVAADSTTVEVTGLDVYADYFYRVSAVLQGGETEDSNLIYVQTDLVAPTATAATDLQADSFTANWDALAGVLDYRLDVLEMDEDFADGNFTAGPAWAGDTGSFEILTDATVPSGNASSDGSFLASKSNEGHVSLSIASTETNEWRFSLASPNFNPSSGNYFGAILIASAQPAGGIDGSNFLGYYLAVGRSTGTADTIELWRKTGAGEEKEGDFNLPDLDPGALRDGMNLKVTRDGNGVFQLWYSTGFEFDAEPTTYAGAVTNTQYTGTSSHFGVFGDFGNPDTSRRVYVDNITLGDRLVGYDDLAVAGTSQSVSGLSANTTYLYLLRAEFPNGTSGDSNVIITNTTGAGDPSGAMFLFR